MDYGIYNCRVCECKQKCAEHVEQNGLRIYGLVADMDRDDMLELLEDDTVYAIGIEGVE